MAHQSEVRDASARQQDAEQSSWESCGLVAQELRTQITLMVKELLEYKANTDPLSTRKWLELVCCAAAVPEREIVLPKTGELENMDYRQLSRLLEEMANKLENEKRYWGGWQWAINEKGGIEAAAKWFAAAIGKRSDINVPEHACLNASQKV